MIVCSHPTPNLFRRAFTLIELLVVVAIIAVVGSGVAVTYGRKTINDSKDQMTLHEMQEIKKAFLQFHNDNYLRLHKQMNDHTGSGDLPTSGFQSEFDGNHNNNNPMFDGRMEFFETYGLWFLMQRKIPDVDLNPSPVVGQEAYDHFPEFDTYDVTTGEGWNGPYLDVSSRKAWVFDDINFPQISDRHDGVYRILYYEHGEDVGDPNEPIYRRLLLIAPRGEAAWDEGTSNELLLETGNLRGGDDEGRLKLGTGAFDNHLNEDDDDDSVSRFFILELLNLDQL